MTCCRHFSMRKIISCIEKFWRGAASRISAM
jgi:hypothetical protein